MDTDPTIIGRVTRFSTRGFVGAARAPEPELPIFGSFCKARAQQGKSQVIGLIYNISIEDDELTRQMAAADRPKDEELADQQVLRQIPVEYAVLSIGYQSKGEFYYTLPPQPPLALAPIHVMPEEEILEFTQKLDFIPLILSAVNLPTDDLLAACLRNAASTHHGPEQSSFLTTAGRTCARYLSEDLNRLETILRNLKTEAMKSNE